MLSRALLVSRQVARAAVSAQPVRYAAADSRAIAVQFGHDLDCMTVPQGSWKDDHNARHRNYHMHLAGWAVLNVIFYVASHKEYTEIQMLPTEKKYQDQFGKEKVLNKF